MNDEDKNESKNNNYFLLKCFYLIKVNGPNSESLYIILFTLKYIGLIVNSRIVEMTVNKDIISVNKYLVNFFIFGKSLSPILNHYHIITLFGAILLVIYGIFGFSSTIYVKFKYSKIKNLMGEKTKKESEKVERTLFRVITSFYFIFVFFHQYILEYYFFGFYAFIYYQMGVFSKNGSFSSIYIDNLHEDFYEYFSENNHLVIFIFNLVVIIVIFYIMFIFLSFNSTKGLFLAKGIYCGNKKYLIMKIILLSTQPIFGITNFYEDKTKIIIGLIINGFIIIFCLISFWSCLYQFGFFPNTVSNLALFFEFFAFFSSIFEIIIYFTGTNNSVIFFLLKLIIELINSFFFMRLFLYLKDKHNLKSFARTLFSKNNQNLEKGGLYYYMRMYLEYQKDKTNNYLKLFSIIIEHVKNCKKLDCPGHILIPKESLKSSFIPINIKDKKINKSIISENEIIKEKKDIDKEKENEKEKEAENDDSDEENILINNYFDNIKENNKMNNLKDTIFGCKRLKEKQFQIIFEQEIINKIEYLYKSKKYFVLEDFLFIHLQYLYAMKKNYSLALYYAGKYSKCGIKWSLMTQYFLFEYKKVLINSFFNKTNINNIDQNANKYRKDNLLMDEIINYFIFSFILKNLIINSCLKLKLLFNFQKDLHIPLFIKSYNRSKTKKFFEMGEDLKNNIEKIKYLLHQHIKELNQQTISAELSYIMSNFFIFTENKIPYELRKIINPEFDVNTIANKLQSGYKFLNIVHPLILTLTKNNKFSIFYFSSVICNRLGFYQYEIKDKDFHEKLFPGTRFIKQHELLMKQFLFFNINSYIKKDTFLKTKEGYLLGVTLNAKKFPTFYDEFFLIIGLDFNDELFLSEINKNFNRYSFLLDENLDFVSQTQNFYDDFEFNIYMFKEMKTNFFEFFCIDKNKFNEELKNKNCEFFKKNSVNNIYNLKKEDDAFSIFKTISYEKAYELRDISKLESMKNEHIIIKGKISKEKILKMIPEFSKLIEEYGLDCEWYQHLENLSERLSLKEIKKEEDSLTEYSKNIISLGFNLNPKKSYKNSFLTNNSSTNILLNNKNNSNKDAKNNEIKENLLINNFNNSNNNLINFNIESLGPKSISNYSLLSKKNDINNNINNEENNNKKLIDNNHIRNTKIILDRNFDVTFNLRKIGTVYYYIVDIYEKTLYRNDNHNSVIYEPKNKLSFCKKKYFAEESLIINDKNNEDSKFIKAKTLFSQKSKNRKDMPDLGNIKNELIEENNVQDDKIIQKVKTWASENNSIDIQKHLIKEGERIFNNTDSLVVDSKNEKISANSDRNEKNKNISIRNSKNAKKGGTRRILKDKLENNNNHRINKSNHYSIHNSKTKEEDEEKIFLITKENLEEYRKKNHTVKSYFIIFYFISKTIIIIIIVIKLILAKTNFAFTSNLTNGMIFLEEIKSDIYIGSILLLSQCYRKDIPIGLSNYFIQLQVKSTDLMGHLNLFEKQLKSTGNNNLLSNIMSYLYQNITIFNLNPDWSSKIENSYLLKEFNYFSYLLNEQSYQFINKCDFDNNLYLLFLNTPEEIYNKNNKTDTSFNQRFIYYVLYNIFYTFNPIINNIIEEIIYVQVKIMNNYLSKIIIINSILIFVVIISEILVLIKNMIDSNFIKHIFLYIYDYDQKQIQFEYEINYLEITAREFNLNNLIQLENIKKYNYSYLNMNNGNNIDENHINGLRDSLKNKNNKNPNLIEGMINKSQKLGNEFEQNSFSGSMFNNSMNNNSMMQLLNKNNKDEINKLKYDNKKPVKNSNTQINKKIKNEMNNKIGLNEGDKSLQESEEILELLKNNKKIIPSTIIITINCSIVITFLLVLTIVLNLININKKRNIWEYAVNLSVNYLEKIPKIIELCLSTYLTVIIGDPTKANYTSKVEYPKKQAIFMRYFTTMKNYDNSELISSNIKDSFFANELYDNYRIKKNIEFCENDKSFQNYFKRTKYWNKKLNEKGNFCINLALESIIFFNKLVTTLDNYFSYVTQISLSCSLENPKLIDSGLDLEIDLILHELTYLYIDFEERLNENLTLAREKFFENENFQRMLRDINIPFTFADGTLFSATSEDMKNLNKNISQNEVIYISITLIIDILILCSLIIMIFFNEKAKNILVFLGNILKK